MAVADARFPIASAQPFEHLVLDFLAYLEFERGLSRNTLEAYRSDLLQYGAYLDGRDPLAVTHSDLAAFVDAVGRGDGDRPPVAPATLQRKVACLRSFHRHLRRQGLLQADPDGEPARAAAEPPAAARAQPRPGGPPARAAARDRARGAARPGAARADVRLRPARLGGDRPGGQRRRPGRRRAAHPRQGVQGAARAGRVRGGPRRHRLSRPRPPAVGGRPARAAAVRQPARRGADAPGPLQDRPAPCRRGGPRRAR